MIEFSNDHVKSKLTGCLLISNGTGEPMFIETEERGIQAHLEGYAIIPLELYNRYSRPWWQRLIDRWKGYVYHAS